MAATSQRSRALRIAATLRKMHLLRKQEKNK
jgi:hypothetical protein